MKGRTLTLTSTVLLCLALSAGCPSQPTPGKGRTAAGGGPAAIAGGVILGGLLGGAVGNALDQRDKELAMKQAQYSLENSPSGQGSEWRNPDSGNSGTFTPTRTYQTESGQYCREYTQEILVAGEKHQSYGTACRQPDGSWQIQN